MKSLKLSLYTLIYMSVIVGSSVGCSLKNNTEQSTQQNEDSKQKINAALVKSKMDEQPIKYDGFGQPVQVESKFTQQDIDSNNFVLYKDCYRNSNVLVGIDAKAISKCLAQSKSCSNSSQSNCSGRAGFQSNDRAESLISKFPGEKEVVNNIFEMMDKDLDSSSLDDTPWSDDYWAIYKGVLAARYADSSFPQVGDWKTNFEYSTLEQPVSTVLATENQDQINKLSPAEKYDLLIGIDSSDPKSLTADMWRQGKGYYDTNGSVETWMGICHGWAPAAYKSARPLNPIEVLAADGVTKVTFYQSDIKGLTSYLWATARTPSRFIGGRCNVKSPEKDDSSGRVTDQDCFDTNPGTWHTAIVNLIGVQRESFVLDATYDYEVWNQPAYSYSFKYFNPITGETTEDVRDSMVPVSEYENDAFKKFRSPKAKFILNIVMNTSYIVETRPSHYSTSKDAVHSVAYSYDLELDENGTIVGGEWHTNKHPDFLWTPNVDNARVYEDKAIQTEWSVNEKLPTDWTYGAKSAAKRGNVLGRIVEKLVQESQEPVE